MTSCSQLRDPCCRWLTYLSGILLVLGSCPLDLQAIDETESLGLLVETLEANDDAGIRTALLKGMLRGLEGRRNVPAPKGWSELSAKLTKSDDASVRDLSTQLSQIFGDRAAVQRALAVLKDQSSEPGVRRTALRSLLTQQNREASALLESLLDQPALTLDAVRGYATVENATAAAVLLSRYPEMNPDLKRAVVETLATRKSYAQKLLTAVQQEKVTRDEIPAHVARSLNSLLGQQFVKVFGKVRPVAQDREKLIAKYKKLLTPSKIADADASRGRVLFKKTCASCHLLYGDGAKIGPDLTGSNRANLDYILLNSVDPSFDVPASYKMVSIITVEGRVLNGVIAEEDAIRVVLKTVEQPRVVILKEDIDIRKISPRSMMPEGQLDKMKQQEVADLIKYLRTTEQVEMAQ
ncbi:MAG: c-type cytochrome [Planctomycetaceae bacterium]|nr:c-type cytochrome [Planctomycetaceae bacterium]